MAKPATEQEPAPGSLDRAAFEALLKARGIALSTEEAESVFGLASWLNEGVAHLDTHHQVPDVGWIEGPAEDSDAPDHEKPTQSA